MSAGATYLEGEPSAEADAEDHVPPVDPLTAEHRPNGELAQLGQSVQRPCLEALAVHRITILITAVFTPRPIVSATAVPCPSLVRHGFDLGWAREGPLRCAGPERDRPMAQRLAVNPGDDAGTTGAVFGQLAGACSTTASPASRRPGANGSRWPTSSLPGPNGSSTPGRPTRPRLPLTIRHRASDRY